MNRDFHWSPVLSCHVVVSRRGAASVLQINWVLDRVSFFIKCNVDELVTCRFIKGYLHRPGILHAHRARVIGDARDSVLVQRHLHIVFGEDLNCCAELVSKDDLALVTLQGSSRNKDCLSCGLDVPLPSVLLARTEPELLSCLSQLGHLFSNLLVACINHLMRLHRIVVVLVSEQVLVRCPVKQQEQLVLVNGSDLTETIVEGTRLLGRLHDSPHANHIAVLVSAVEASFLRNTPAHSFSLKSDCLLNQGQFYHHGLVGVQQYFQAVGLYLQDQAYLRVSVENNEVTSTVYFFHSLTFLFDRGSGLRALDQELRQ